MFEQGDFDCCEAGKYSDTLPLFNKHWCLDRNKGRREKPRLIYSNRTCN